MAWVFLFVLLLFVTSLSAKAQVNEDSGIEDNDFTQQLWFDFDPSWDVGDNQKIMGEFGYRTIWPKSWHRYIVRASYQYDSDGMIFKKFKHTESLTFGTGLFLLTSKTSHNSFEIRPYQGYKFAFDLRPRVQLQQYIRLEERFVFSNEEDNQVFGMRLRYQIKAIFNLQGFMFVEGRGFYLPVSVEGFFNMVQASEFNDVIRITPGMGYQFDPDFKVEGTLGYHYTRQDADKLVRTNDIVFRFRIIKTFR
ncbi:DUF2490 domain-containing protein [Formosa haliotis]|uniref:DUF2490 domain-containing protein n=1 Tax=Formosa haliotis TaxID=1555194 RepID=UPI000824BE4C|nr:DUF2490 domain-containing protein [Formosa haliotis]